MKRAWFEKNGITIVEVIVTLAVIGIVSTFLYTVLYANWIGYNREIISADLQFDARLAMDKLTKDIMRAETIALDPQNLHALTLTMPGGVNVVYQINSSNQLTRKVDIGSENVLCENVDGTRSGFSWSGPRSIFIDIQLAQSEKVFTKGKIQNVEVKLRSNIVARNG